MQCIMIVMFYGDVVYDYIIIILRTLVGTTRVVRRGGVCDLINNIRLVRSRVRFLLFIAVGIKT